MFCSVQPCVHASINADGGVLSTFQEEGPGPGFTQWGSWVPGGWPVPTLTTHRLLCSQILQGWEEVAATGRWQSSS